MEEYSTQTSLYRTEYMDSKLNTILEHLLEYTKNQSYVYKKCTNGLIVILEKLEDTITNEDGRIVINCQFAKYKADKLQVIKIFDINDLTFKTSAISIYDPKFIYKTGAIVESEVYNKNIICSKGLHYFKTVTGAYYYKLDNATILKTYDNDGGLIFEALVHQDYMSCTNYKKNVLRTKFNCINNKIEGLCTKYYKNGVINFIANYKNENIEGRCYEYRKNGSIKCISNYEHGYLHGQLTEYWKNDIKLYQVNFKYGKKNGLWINWNNNGCILETGQYHNDQRTGWWLINDIHGNFVCNKYYRKN